MSFDPNGPRRSSYQQRHTSIPVGRPRATRTEDAAADWAAKGYPYSARRDPEVTVEDLRAAGGVWCPDSARWYFRANPHLDSQDVQLYQGITAVIDYPWQVPIGAMIWRPVDGLDRTAHPRENWFRVMFCHRGAVRRHRWSLSLRPASPNEYAMMSAQWRNLAAINAIEQAMADLIPRRTA